MRINMWWLGLFLTTLAACRLGVWAVHLGAACGPATGTMRCHDQTLLTDLALMLIPVALLCLRGFTRGLHQMSTTRRMLRTLRTRPPAPLPPDVREQAQRLGVAHRLDIVTWDRAEAFCYGFVHPRICMSTGLLALLGPAEVEAVLRHERHHLQRRDPLRVLGWTMLCGACWWLTERAAQAELLRELAADRAVIREQGRAPLASALLTLLTQPHDAHLHGLAVSGVSVTDARIDQLLAPDQQTSPLHASLLGRWMLGPLALLGYVVVCSVVMAFVP